MELLLASSEPDSSVDVRTAPTRSRSSSSRLSERFNDRFTKSEVTNSAHELEKIRAKGVGVSWDPTFLALLLTAPAFLLSGAQFVRRKQGTPDSQPTPAAHGAGPGAGA